MDIKDFNFLDESAKRMVKNLIRENELAVQLMDMPKAKSIYMHIMSICRNASGESRPPKGFSRVPMEGLSMPLPGSGVAPSSVTVHGGGYVVNAGSGYNTVHPEILESSGPKLVDQLNTKDWWELGKEIIKD